MSAESPELVWAMRRAEACGFRFWKPSPGAAWWGERESAGWAGIVFLDPCGLCNACRGHTRAGAPLFADRVSGDALTVLSIVTTDWTA